MLNIGLIQSFKQANKQAVNQSVSQLVSQSINQSVRQSVKQAVSHSLNPVVSESYQSFRQSVNQSVRQAGSQLVSQSARQSVSQSFLQSVSQVITCSLFRYQFQVVFHNGTDCSEPSDRACSTFSSCSTCLASFPYATLNPNCGWCVGCSSGGKCVKSSEDCNLVHPCDADQILRRNSDKCLANSCEATTCLTCLGPDSKCLWTPQLKLNTEVSVTLSPDPYKFEWNCWGNLADQDSLNLTVMVKASARCPQPCSAHRTCSACLSSRGQFDLVSHFSCPFRHNQPPQRSSLDLSNSLPRIQNRAGRTTIASLSHFNAENSNRGY